MAGWLKQTLPAMLNKPANYANSHFTNMNLLSYFPLLAVCVIHETNYSRLAYFCYLYWFHQSWMPAMPLLRCCFFLFYDRVFYALPTFVYVSAIIFDYVNYTDRRQKKKHFKCDSKMIFTKNHCTWSEQINHSTWWKQEMAEWWKIWHENKNAKNEFQMRPQVCLFARISNKFLSTICLFILIFVRTDVYPHK